MDQFWGEYVPNWIAAVSTALAFIAAGTAAYFAWHSLRQDAWREERARALGLEAWWVEGTSGGRRVWGVLVSNATSANFHDVEIEAAGGNNPKAGQPIQMINLPPGRYFVESLPKVSDQPWAHRVSVSDEDRLQPLAQARTRNVRLLKFTDSTGTRWQWELGSGLARLGPPA